MGIVLGIQVAMLHLLVRSVPRLKDSRYFKGVLTLPFSIGDEFSNEGSSVRAGVDGNALYLGGSDTSSRSQATGTAGSSARVGWGGPLALGAIRVSVRSDTDLQVQGGGDHVRRREVGFLDDEGGDFSHGSLMAQVVGAEVILGWV